MPSKNKKLTRARRGIFFIGAILIAAIFLANKFIWQKNNQPTPKPFLLVNPYDFKMENPVGGYAIEFFQIKNAELDVKINRLNSSELKKPIEIKNEETLVKSKPKINTEIIFGNPNLQFNQAKIKLKATGT